MYDAALREIAANSDGYVSCPDCRGCARQSGCQTCGNLGLCPREKAYAYADAHRTRWYYKPGTTVNGF